MNTQYGRSMVEMLGVLAIIGVLSVGAIAGYSKAMMKYKLNKQAEQLSTVINLISGNLHSFDNLPKGTSLIPIFIKMGEIPKEMINPKSSYYIHDIFGQYWRMIIHPDSGIVLATYADYGGASALSSKSADNLEICKNMFLVAKENHDNIAMAYTSSTSSENTISKMSLYGDNLCTSSVKCLKDASLDDIYTLCTKHIAQNRAIFFEILWK